MGEPALPVKGNGTNALVAGADRRNRTASQGWAYHGGWVRAPRSCPGEEPPMPRKTPNLTTQLFRTARASGTARSAVRGPIPFSKRVVRRKLHATVNRRAGKSLHGVGL